VTLSEWLAPRPADASWELPAESIAVKIRWFGLVVGLLLANFAVDPAARWPLNAILAFGVIFTLLDTSFYRDGRVFLRDQPLLVSGMEAVYIGLLCESEAGPASPFRFYYLLSLICCAVRYAPRVTFVTCGLDGLSYAVVFAVADPAARDPSVFVLTCVILAWVTWAAASMARLLRRASDDLRALNGELRDNQATLETRIAERTRDFEESQAQVLHQEKMAAFGLLAAGIAHEVGNPLAAISAVVQMIERRETDAYTRDKLQLVTPELARIQAILRELIDFSRPASGQAGPVNLGDVASEALRIARFYKGGKSRQIVATVEPDLPVFRGVRDQFVQVVFNLVLNAIDATDKGGTIRVFVRHYGGVLRLRVDDDGVGIAAENLPRLFKPYFTTKPHGTGLGLFVIRRIVEAHGGTVTVESAAGEGTAFLVRLPVAGPVAAAVGPAEDHA